MSVESPEWYGEMKRVSLRSTMQPGEWLYYHSRRPWEQWFAWYPVKLAEGYWAWLRPVCFRRDGFNPFAGRYDYDYAEPAFVAMFKDRLRIEVRE